MRNHDRIYCRYSSRKQKKENNMPLNRNCTPHDYEVYNKVLSAGKLDEDGNYVHVEWDMMDLNDPDIAPSLWKWDSEMCLHVTGRLDRNNIERVTFSWRQYQRYLHQYGGQPVSRWWH